MFSIESLCLTLSSHSIKALNTVSKLNIPNIQQSVHRSNRKTLHSSFRLFVKYFVFSNRVTMSFSLSVIHHCLSLNRNKWKTTWNSFLISFSLNQDTLWIIYVQFWLIKFLFHMIQVHCDSVGGSFKGSEHCFICKDNFEYSHFPSLVALKTGIQLVNLS